MANFIQVSEEVYYSANQLTCVSKSDIEFLKEKALANSRLRTRLCTHHETTDPVHEMFIVHAHGAYVRPHKHLGKSESFHIIEGMVDVVIFNETGEITNVFHMGDMQSGLDFYYRIDQPFFHSLVIRSELLVFHEITKGPFNREATVFADWSPRDEDVQGVNEFMIRLNSHILNNERK